MRKLLLSFFRGIRSELPYDCSGSISMHVLAALDRADFGWTVLKLGRRKPCVPYLLPRLMGEMETVLTTNIL